MTGARQRTPLDAFDEMVDVWDQGYTDRANLRRLPAFARTPEGRVKIEEQLVLARAWLPRLQRGAEAFARAERVLQEALDSTAGQVTP